MHPEDKEMIVGSRQPKESKCYVRAMTVIFKEILGDLVECFVDDLVTKHAKEGDHLGHLKRTFGRLQQS